MTTLLLCRHGATDAIGKRIVGRIPGIDLNPHGVVQARELAAHLRALPVEAIYSSPLERCLQTAAPCAEALDLSVREHEGLNELDFGAWSGLTLAELDGIPEWKQFN